MTSNRTRVAVAVAAVAAVVVMAIGGVALVVSRAQPDIEPVPVVAAAPPVTPGTVAVPPPPPPTTAAPYRSVVATATVAELEVLADRPLEAGTADPPPPPTTVPVAPARVAAIPRVGLNSIGSRKTTTGWAFANPTPFGSPLVVAVTEIDGDWVQVRIPARPNSQQGWVRASDVAFSESEFRMELTLSERLLRVFQGDDVVVETPVVIGTDATPTPIGTFYLGEVLTSQQAGVGGPYGAYGPFILATSAYSEALDLFGGGLPVIAFHGTNQPGLIGSQASNGCVRMANEVVTELAAMLPPGTVITVAA